MDGGATPDPAAALAAIEAETGDVSAGSSKATLARLRELLEREIDAQVPTPDPRVLSPPFVLSLLSAAAHISQAPPLGEGEAGEGVVGVFVCFLL